MLAVARQKRKQLPAEVAKQLQLHHGDMCEFELGQQFAFIFVAFRLFQNLLTPEAQRQSLICVREHLSPDGKLFINLFDPRYDLILPGVFLHYFGPIDSIHHGAPLFLYPI